MNDKRENQILSIQDYLREKEKEMENSRISKDDDRNSNYSPIGKIHREEIKNNEKEYIPMEHYIKRDDYTDNHLREKRKVDFDKDDDFNHLKFDDNTINNLDLYDDLDDNLLNDKDSDEKKIAKVNEKKINKIWNIIFIITIILIPLFGSLTIISNHTNYLVRKPFDLICFTLTIVNVVLLFVSLVFMLKNRDKKVKIKFKIPIMISVLTMLDAVFLVLFIKLKLWNLMDKIITHYKLLLIIIDIVIASFVALLIIIKVKKLKLKKSVKKIILAFIMTLYVLCFVDGLTVLYKSNAFREWLITTAMQTMNHQYLCKWFYSESEINKVLDNNYVLESGESTDASLITKEEVVTYANEYERQVLEREAGAVYKIINLDVNGCKGYLGVIYDPTTVHLAVTDHLGSYGQYVTTMAKNNNAVLAINGAGFYDPGYSSTGGNPSGITISDGKIITRGEYGTITQSGGIIGFDQEGILYLLKNLNVDNAINMGIKNAVTWGPFLIVNGERSFIKGNGGWGYAARTAIGQRKDGIVLFLVVDSNASRTKGADMVDLTDIMENYGAVNAANLDGGTSSVMVENGVLINDPIDGALRHQTRAIADSFVVIPK